MAVIRSFRLFFPLLLTASLTVQSEIIHYESDLSLILLKDGTQSFIEKSRNLPIEEYKKALNDIIALKNLNGTDIIKLFEHISQNLNQRINSIENKNADAHTFSRGILFTLMAAGLTYNTYYSYIKPYQENRDQYNSLKKHFKDNRIKIEQRGKTIYFTLISENDYLQERNQFVKLENSANAIIDNLINWALPLPGVFYICGIIEFFYAFNAQRENKYLKMYKQMLTVITQLQKKYCQDSSRI